MSNDNNPELRIIGVLEYCKPHLAQIWASRIVGILLNCDFKDAKNELARKAEYANDVEYLIEAVMDSRLAIIRADELREKYRRSKK